MNDKDRKSVFIGFIIGGIFAVLMLSIYMSPDIGQNTSLSKGTQQSIQNTTNNYKNIKLQAKSAIVYKPQTGEILYEKNKNIQLPLASITKVMNAIVVNENTSNNKKVAFANSSWSLSDYLTIHLWFLQMKELVHLQLLLLRILLKMIVSHC